MSRLRRSALPAGVPATSTPPDPPRAAALHPQPRNRARRAAHLPAVREGRQAPTARSPAAGSQGATAKTATSKAPTPPPAPRLALTWATPPTNEARRRRRTRPASRHHPDRARARRPTSGMGLALALPVRAKLADGTVRPGTGQQRCTWAKVRAASAPSPHRPQSSGVLTAERATPRPPAADDDVQLRLTGRTMIVAATPRLQCHGSRNRERSRPSTHGTSTGRRTRDPRDAEASRPWMRLMPLRCVGTPSAE